MKPEFRPLVAAAKKIRARAYAPYSNYQVGAAVRGDDGVVYPGANIENASYGLCLCAERSAVAAAVLAGCKRLTAVAVVTDSDPPAAPCGMCRQTLAEFARDMPVILVNLDGVELETTLDALLPHGFRAEEGVFEPPQAKAEPKAKAARARR